MKDMNDPPHQIPLSNGIMQRPSQGTSFNGTSFEIIDHSPSSSTGNRTPQDLSYLNPMGLGQISITDITLEQALEKVHDLMKENKELRDYLKENNEMMRQQYQTLSEWKEKIHDSNKVNKEKFEETRRVILQLRDENSQLKERLQVHDDMHTETTVTLNVKIKELEHTASQLTEDISVKDKAICKLQEQLQDLTLQSQNVQSRSSKSETIYVAHSEDEEVKIQTLTEERNKQATVIVELTSQLKDLQQNIEKLQNDLKESQKIQETAQSESDRYLRESEDLSSKIESILGDMKTLRSENKMLKNEKLELELKVDELQRKVGSGSTKGLTGSKTGDKWDFPSFSSGEEMVSPPEESKPETALPIMSAVETSYGKDEVKEIQSQLNQKELQVDQLLEELRNKERELCQFRECQNRQHQSKISPDHDKLGPKTTYLLNAPTSDLHSLRSQNMSLMTEITDTQSKLEAAKQAMDKRNSRVAELEEVVKRVNDDLMKQRNEDGAMIQSLKMTLGNYEQALNAERKEHQNTKKQMADLRQAYNSLMTDYKSVLHGYEALKQEKSHQGIADGEKKKMLSEISRLTAQILSAEESINYRDNQLQELRKENDKLKEDVQTIPVLNAQADVWKADFQAERDSREAEHAENERLKQEVTNLRLQNQQLIDETHSYSKAQFTEMQRKYAQPGQHSHQQQLQGHLRVGGPPVGYPVQYPLQYHHGYQNRENSDGQMLPPLKYPHPSLYPGTSVDPPLYPQQQNPQVHQQQQAEEDYQPLSCPKCNLVCPDVDTLQIHVLDCIEQ